MGIKTFANMYFVLKKFNKFSKIVGRFIRFYFK